MTPYMRSLILPFLICLLAATGCRKTVSSTVDSVLQDPVKGKTIDYLIAAGQHYANQNGYQPVNLSTLSFTVKFDSSAVYRSVEASNQEDINKLYGFADNNANHEQYSARIGWNWARNALRLYAYVYNAGVRSSQEIGAVSIGSEHSCSIKVVGNQYQFTVDKLSITMPRSSQTTQAEGYRLFPYFGGDETAPHDIHIVIHES